MHQHLTCHSVVYVDETIAMVLEFSSPNVPSLSVMQLSATLAACNALSQLQLHNCEADRHAGAEDLNLNYVLSRDLISWCPLNCCKPILLNKQHFNGVCRNGVVPFEVQMCLDAR